MNMAFREHGRVVLGDRYFTLRIEDLALDPDPRPTLRRLLKFLGSHGDAGAEQVLEAAIVASGNHSSSYGGNKFRQKGQNSLKHALNGLDLPYQAATDTTHKPPVGPDLETLPHAGSSVETLDIPAVLVGLQYFGYGVNDWGVSLRHWSATQNDYD
jgi:hypothetical protein